MMDFVLKTILLISLLSFSVTVQAETIKLALSHIPEVMEYKNESAPYTRLITNVTKHLPFEFELVYMPSGRANKLLNAKKISCIFPTIPTRTTTVATNYSHPVNGIKLYIFSLPPKLFRSLDELVDQPVIHLRGYIFGGLINDHPEISFQPVSTQNAAIGMLQRKRAAAYIDYIPDTRFSLSAEDFSSLNYAENSPILTAFDRFECISRNNENDFLDKFNAHLKQLKAKGELKIILGKYYVSTE